MSEHDIVPTDRRPKQTVETHTVDTPSIAVQGHNVIMRQEHQLPNFAGNMTLVITNTMTPRAARHMAKQLSLCANAAEEDKDV
jgi:hypothetical protein